jgi:hypothetical protein
VSAAAKRLEEAVSAALSPSSPGAKRAAWLALSAAMKEMLTASSLTGGASPWDYSSFCVGRLKKLGLVRGITTRGANNVQGGFGQQVTRYTITDAGRAVLVGRNMTHADPEGA